MRLVLSLSLLCFGATASLPGQGLLMTEVPLMRQIQPANGTVGSVLRATGVHLGKAKVDEVYITDQKFDMKCKILAQTDDSIEFRIPPEAKPGRLELLVKTAGRDPLLLEQPVYITIEASTGAPKVTLAANTAKK